MNISIIFTIVEMFLLLLQHCSTVSVHTVGPCIQTIGRFRPMHSVVLLFSIVLQLTFLLGVLMSALPFQ